MQSDVKDMRSDEPTTGAAADVTESAASDDALQQQQQQEVAIIEQQLADSPMQYELHVRLLRLLRSLHETDALRAARQRMADLFPLTADLWHEWLDDERQRIDSHDDQVKLLALHQRACKDYLVPSLWIQYVQYAEQLLYSADEQQWGDEEHDTPDSGVNRVRAVYDEAARVMGAHQLDGEKLWGGYRKFEVSVLIRMLQLKEKREEDRDSMEEEKEEEEEDEAKEEEDTEEEKQHVSQLMKQLERIVAVYRRCLSLPLNGLEQAYNEYRRFVQQQGVEVEDAISNTFKQAKAQREARTPYERALPQPDPSSPPPTGQLSADGLSAWYAYIQFEHQQSAKRRPARVNVLYERALASSFLHADMWSAYTLFLEDRSGRHEKREEEKRVNGEEEQDTVDEVAELLSVYQRAVRNVPYLGALWSGLIRAHERRGSGQDEVTAVHQRASEALASRGGDELASVCLSMADFLRRQLRAQLQRENRSRSRSPMRSPTKSSSSNTAASSYSATLSLPFSRPPSKRTVTTTALDTIRPIFHQAVQALRYHNPASSHPAHHRELTASVFLAYHSLERHDARDTAAARDAMEQWADIAGGESRVWVEWAGVEAEAGEVAYARHVYKRGLERLLLDWSAESVCWEWLRFEREHGSVDDYCAARRRCEKLFGQFNAARNAMQLQQTNAPTTTGDTGTDAQTHDVYAVHTDGAGSAVPLKERTQEARPRDKDRKDKRNKKRSKRDSTAGDKESKQAHADSAEQVGNHKKRKTDKQKTRTKRIKKGDDAVQEGTSGTAVGEEENSAEPEPSAETAGGGQSNPQQQPVDGVESATQPVVPRASADDGPVPSPAASTVHDNQPTSAAKAEHVVEHPTRTLLVSNLSWVTTRDTLQSLFQPHGDIESVLLSPDAASHKQYAYVVYASKDAIKAAVAALHSHTIDGSSVDVECIAHRHKREKQQQKVAAHRNLTVFIRQLQPRDDVEARLKVHFASCGSIARVRLSRDNKTGELGNVAWIELADKEVYDRALQLDGSVMEGDEQPIRVAPNRPPPPRQGGGSRKVGDEQVAVDRQRSRLQLMPRAVQAHEQDKRSDHAAMVEDTAGSAGADAMETSDASKESATQAPPVMSNNDFRAMLTRRK